MEYIRITKENIDKEHICCAMSGKQSLPFRTVHTGFLLFSGKYFKPVQFRGRLIRIQNVATKTGCTPRQRHTIRRGDILL